MSAISTRSTVDAHSDRNRVHRSPHFVRTQTVDIEPPTWTLSDLRPTVAQVRITCIGLDRTGAALLSSDNADGANAIARFPGSQASSAKPQNGKCESTIAGPVDAIYIALHVLHDLPHGARTYAKRSGEAYGCAFGVQAMTHRSAEEWLEIRAAADLAGVSDDTIRRRIRSGELPRAKRGDKPTDPWLIPMGDLVSSGLLTGVPGEAPTGPRATAMTSAPPLPSPRRDVLLVHLGALREVHAALERQITIVEQLTTGADS